MNSPHDPNVTADIPSGATDSLDAGLAAGYGRPARTKTFFGPGHRPTLLLKEAAGESDLVVKLNSDALPTPSEVGDRYQLSGEIARGGMGVVLRGRDVDLGRDLAVKVLLGKYANKPEVNRRFVEEAQIGGQLQHPGVVPVYDIGRFGDRPFFTMKLVKGQTLAALLSARADPAADRPRFLGMALQVSQTLAYAHAKGVIHRDLKPANVMVGAFGEVQVMDWGLAKVLAEGGVADEEQASRLHNVPEDVTTIRTTRSSGSVGSYGTHTEAGSLLGTPAYMPPEQANGDVANLDRRADVFGLGAILCEVLTGKPPYVGRSSEEVRRKAANGDLADAHARLDGCGADAELIALTRACLAAEPIDRPRDAGAVADALTAYLDGVQERLHEAELAGAAAKAKAVEEIKRRRLTVALAATVLLALTAGGGGWLWLKADRDARQAQMTRDVNEALNRATTLREQAKAATVGSAALFAQAREQTQRAMALVPSGSADVALQVQVRQLQSELDEEEKDRTLLVALDAARLAQAETLSENRFASERAVPLFREALRDYGLAAGSVEPGAAAERIRQRPAAVREAIAATLDEWIILATDPQLKLDEPHLDWLKSVAEATQPADGWTREFRAARAEKDAAKRQASAWRPLAGRDDGRPRRTYLPAQALTRLARGLHGVHAEAAAVRLLRRARDLYPADFWVNHELGMALQEVTPPERAEAVRFLTAAVALRPESAGVHLGLGIALQSDGRPDEGIACFRKAIELDPKYANAHNNLGAALKGLPDEAITCFRKALELDPKHAMAHCNLGNVLKDKGQLDEAIACYRKALELDPKLASAHSNLGNALKDKGQLDEAIACCRKAIELDPKFAKAHNNLGIVLKEKGLPDEAIPCFRKAIELDPKYANAHNNLGVVLKEKGLPDEAIPCFRKAIELDPKQAMAHNNLGGVLREKGRLDEAIACYRKAIELDPKSATAYIALGNALRDKGQVGEAIACYRKAIELDPKLAGAHNNLGYALRDQGQLDEAIACLRKAIELDPKYAMAYSNLGVAAQKKTRAGRTRRSPACAKPSKSTRSSPRPTTTWATR